ncbi:hypothetical protein PB2503_09909 [Parvularcula bermudensis HTCC2503]|uniref:SUF system FeS cluster assembly SufBD core domain-containing protein n=1 Tax=Parvularcula bermudensis (strain ATCC BAA-594 / HTCC2503 / KCTC 12087) TaxID=314260 RepID=E0TEE8_PARBH|nr:Fe-S cluster assembly protein SufD [Parvularcula bermudensis]ADM10034.1 hypothetical protein PB2503_09909 [Parvularcula bermudensis HTCC2503]
MTAAPPLSLTAAEEALLADLPEGPVKDRLATEGLPSRRTEAWRWSDIRAALSSAYSPSAPLASTVPPSLWPEEEAFVVLLGNGRATVPADVPEGVTITREPGRPEIIGDAPLASLLTAKEGLSLTLAPGVSATIVLRRMSDGEGYHGDRVRIGVAEGAHLRLIETHEVAGGGAFSNSLTDIDLADGAHLDRFVLQPAAQGIIAGLARLRRTATGSARIRQLVLSGGAKLSRHETLISGGHADIILDGLYRLSEERHADLTSLIDHEGPDGRTRQLVKGIVGDQGRGVFQGKFRVDRKAQRTDAQMSHHALLLSEGAQVSAKPELEIYADDVECAHGNSVGALDDEALFYLRQRGVREEAARELLIGAFAGEVLNRIEDEDFRRVAEDIWKGMS